MKYMKNMKNMKEKKSRKFKILASVLGIVVGVSSIFAPACATKSVDDTYINDNGELIVVYTDGTQKNLGVVKGEDGKDGANGLDGKDGIDGVDGVDGKDGIDGADGKDGKDGIDGVDGKDLTACAHEYGDWQTEIEATCTSIGYDTRACALCGDIDYRFNEAGEHNYDMQTAVDVISTCTEHWVNAPCKNCNDTKLVQTYVEHSYDGCTCTECGYNKPHYCDIEYISEAEVITDTCSEKIYQLVCDDCSETFTIEDQPTIEHNFKDNVCVDCGAINCNWNHSYNNKNVCIKCGYCSNHKFSDDYSKLEHVFSSELVHYGYSQCNYCNKVELISIAHHYDFTNAVDVINNCEEHWVDATCCDCYSTFLVETYVEHPYDKNGVCTECGEIVAADKQIETDESARLPSGDGYMVDEQATYLDQMGNKYTIFYQYLESNDAYMILGYAGNPVSVILNGTFNEKPIIRIYGRYNTDITPVEYGAFQNCTTLKRIVLPSNIKNIYMYAFRFCTNLQEVILSNNLTAIPQQAFRGCRLLSEITIPESVTGIGSMAFDGCAMLQNINILNKDITFSANALVGTAYWKNYEGEIVYFNKTCLGAKNPESCSFANIKEGTEVIIAEAFSDCSGLKGINIPSSVTTVGDCAFYNCTSLTEIYMPNTVTDWGEDIFAGCISLKQATIAEGITTLSRGTFNGCAALTNVNIPSTATVIGIMFFNNCTSLADITLPVGLIEIGSQAFGNCTSLVEISIPKGVTSIGSYVFYNCTSLMEITIPQDVTTISGSAFSGCSSLTEIIIHENITSIGSYAFSGCRSLTEIAIPESVTGIGEYAFAKCANLTKIALSQSITAINSGTFSECYSLQKIEIPNGVKTISYNAFKLCISLSTVIIPMSVDTIGSNAFGFCPLLSPNIIPSSVVNLDANAFYGNNETVYINADKTCVVNLENGSVLDLELHENYTHYVIQGVNEFAGDLVIPKEFNGVPIEAISHASFDENTALKSVTIPESFVAFNASPFFNCTNLERVILPTSILQFAYYMNIHPYTLSLKEVLFMGNEQEWDNVVVSTNVDKVPYTVYFYSETEPEEEGNYWHYVDGKPVIWE